MAEEKFCPKCGAERENDTVRKCSCGYVYPQKGLSTGCIVGIVIIFVVIFSLPVLGIVAALTIPSLVNRQNALEAQVKLKKAIASYEDIAYVYMLDKGKKSLAGAFGSNCEQADSYFKIADRQGCNFTTIDGVYWEIDPSTGYIAVTDRKNEPLYGVTMWTEDGNVNDEHNIPSKVKMPSSNPINCIYYPQTFMRATQVQLRELCKK